MPTNLFNFIGGYAGQWKVIKMNAVIGDTLEQVSHLEIAPAIGPSPAIGLWCLKGVRSNMRYTEKQEDAQLVAIQAGLERPEATCAALIPIRKSLAWWSLAQDERRRIFEEQTQHIKTGLHYLPAIARRLYHCRDLGEPFDFLTWFEYAPSDADVFEELVVILRATEEWTYVDREVDIRLIRK